MAQIPEGFELADESELQSTGNEPAITQEQSSAIPKGFELADESELKSISEGVAPDQKQEEKGYVRQWIDNTQTKGKEYLRAAGGIADMFAGFGELLLDIPGTAGASIVGGIGSAIGSGESSKEILTSGAKIGEQTREGLYNLVRPLPGAPSLGDALRNANQMLGRSPEESNKISGIFTQGALWLTGEKEGQYKKDIVAGTMEKVGGLIQRGGEYVEEETGGVIPMEGFVQFTNAIMLGIPQVTGSAGRFAAAKLLKERAKVSPETFTKTMDSYAKASEELNKTSTVVEEAVKKADAEPTPENMSHLDYWQNKLLEAQKKVEEHPGHPTELETDMVKEQVEKAKNPTPQETMAETAELQKDALVKQSRLDAMRKDIADNGATPGREKLLEKFQQDVIESADKLKGREQAPYELAPIREAAFRSKQTGEVFESGAKHDPNLKSSPEMEQGFLDMNGRFITRAEAIEVANKTMPKEIKKAPDAAEGLRAEDFGENGVPEAAKKAQMEEMFKDINSRAERKLEVERAAKSEMEATKRQEDFESKYDIEPRQRAKAEARFKGQRGEVDVPMLATLGLSAIGATIASAMTDDEKLAAGIMGGMVGFGLAVGGPKFPQAFRAVGKAMAEGGKIEKITPIARGAAAVGIGTAVGAWGSDSPIEGALIGSILFGSKMVLPKARKLSTDELFLLRDGNIIRSNNMISNLVREINEAVPSAERRVAISHAIDSGEFKTLNPSELKVAQAVKGFYEGIGAEGIDAGVLKGLRKNYISYIVERDVLESQKTFESRIDSFLKSNAGRESANTKFGKEGKYETFAEINTALKDSGFKLKTEDVGEITAIYGASMRQAIENRVLIDNLKAAKSPDGIEYMTRQDSKGNLPNGYKRVDHPQLQGYGVHPDLKPSIDLVFGSRNVDVVTQGLYSLNMAIKGMNVAGSLFHAKSLAEVNVLANGATPFAGMKMAIERLKAVGLDKEVSGLLQEGLMVSAPSDITRSAIRDIGGFIDSHFVPGKDAKLVSKVLEPAAILNDKIQAFTWDYMHTGTKLSVALKYVEKLTENNAKLFEKDPQKYPLKSKQQINREVAEVLNNMSGGLNWTQIAMNAETQLGRALAMKMMGPMGSKWAQIIAFAPDWAMSTLRTAAGVMGKSEAPIRGLIHAANKTDLYRQYALRSVLYWGTILNGMNMLTAGRSIMSNKDPTRLEFEDGTSIQVGKHSAEAVHALKDPVRFAYNKLGFTPRMAVNMFSGKEGYGEKAPKIDSRFGMVAKAALPFTASQVLQPGLSTGEKVKRSVLSSIGLPKLGYSKEEKLAIKQAKKESFAVRRENTRLKKLAEKKRGY